MEIVKNLVQAIVLAPIAGVICGVIGAVAGGALTAWSGDPDAFATGMKWGFFIGAAGGVLLVVVNFFERLDDD